MKFIASVILPIIWSFQEEPYNIKKIEHLSVDGELTEWSDQSSFYYRTGSSNMEVEGEFAGGDLEVSIFSGWNEEGLSFAITWADDFRHVKNLPVDSATRSLPNGRRFDQMYFYDNLKIQVWVNDYNYSAWFAPREKSLQWNSLRIKEPQGWNSVEVSEPITDFKDSDGVVKMEVLIKWEEFELKPEDIESLRFMVVVTDSDDDERTVFQKFDSGELRFVSVNKRALLQ